jgi:ABC-type multidrug transport system ATPase subunit
MLLIESVTKEYSGFKVLENICLSIPAGKIIGLLGPNGAGKTTLLRILSTVLRASSGHIFYNGTDIEKIRVDFRDSIGYMPEDGGLYLRLTVVQNLKFYMGFYSRPIRDAQLYFYLEQYKLQEEQTRQVGKLSRGTKQKILFLKTLINNPKLFLLDEPLANLDPEIKFQVKNELKQRRNQGNQIVLSSHALSEVEDLCDVMVVLKNGRVLICESMTNLRKYYASVVGNTLESIYLRIIGGR